MDFPLSYVASGPAQPHDVGIGESSYCAVGLVDRERHSLVASCGGRRCRYCPVFRRWGARNRWIAGTVRA